MARSTDMITLPPRVTKRVFNEELVAEASNRKELERIFASLTAQREWDPDYTDSVLDTSTENGQIMADVVAVAREALIKEAADKEAAKVAAQETKEEEAPAAA